MMKKLLLTFFLLVAVISLLAQAPNSFNYQAVVRDSQGEVLQNQNVSLLISILQGSETGTVVYSETHSKNTNDHGLVSLKIGEGTVETDDFSNIPGITVLILLNWNWILTEALVTPKW